MIHWKGWWYCPYQRVSQMTNESYAKFEDLNALILLGSDAMCTMPRDNSHVIHATMNVVTMKHRSH